MEKIFLFLYNINQATFGYLKLNSINFLKKILSVYFKITKIKGWLGAFSKGITDSAKYLHVSRFKYNKLFKAFELMEEYKIDIFL